MSGGVGERLLAGPEGGLGDDAGEQGLGFGEALFVDEGVAALVGEDGVLGVLGGEGGEQGLGGGVVACVEVEAGEQASDVWVGGQVCVQGFYEGQARSGLPSEA